MSVLDKILSYLIPLVSIALSYTLGRIQESHSSKKAVLKERYENFYVPFISAVYRGALWNISDYSASQYKVRAFCFDLVFKNIQYLDRHTLSLIPEYYSAFLNLLEFEDGNQKFTNASEEYNRIFISIVNSVLSESSGISKRLNLPPISKIALSKLAQSQALQQTATQEKRSNTDHIQL